MSEPLQVNLGADLDVYMRLRSSSEGAPVSSWPCYHGHPALGISGHAHGMPEDVQPLHVHHAEIHWGLAVPVQLPDEAS